MGFLKETWLSTVAQHRASRAKSRPGERLPKAELTIANAHFSVGLQLRRIERSRSE